MSGAYHGLFDEITIELYMYYKSLISDTVPRESPSTPTDTNSTPVPLLFLTVPVNTLWAAPVAATSRRKRD